ncbi:hypothetical protein [Devosia sp. DBB001]|nr:hypothetical protein [Devosia sp. DBB001]
MANAPYMQARTSPKGKAILRRYRLLSLFFSPAQQNGRWKSRGFPPFRVSCCQLVATPLKASL